MEKELWKGNEAIAEAAIRAGCDCFFGYPITPQSEVPEYMSAHLPKAGGVFLQSESEVAAINMVYGAAGAGMRAMTSSSSPGISLKQEGITYIAGAELPCVIVNCMRGGPGLGTIQPGQGDYFQATRGGGNGDYRTVVLSPSNVQEAVDFVQEAFDIADQYRNPVMVVMDGLIGQMMEPIEWHPYTYIYSPRTGPPPAARTAVTTTSSTLCTWTRRNATAITRTWRRSTPLMEKNEVRWEEKECEDAEVIITAYGTPARIALTALETLRSEGLKVGLFRPITLWPFPEEALRKLSKADHVKAFVDVEMSSTGQMIDDVRLSVEGQKAHPLPGPRRRRDAHGGRDGGCGQSRFEGGQVTWRSYMRNPAA